MLSFPPFVVVNCRVSSTPSPSASLTTNPYTSGVPPPLPPPEIVIVFVAPVPVAVTPEPTKFKAVAVVQSDVPSS